MIDTTKLRELAQRAAPGPWGYELDHGSYLRIYSDADSGIVDGCGCCGSPNCDEANANFIVAANPATVLALLDELERTQGSVAITSAALSAAERELQRLRPIEAAARNLVKVKGRHNSELAMNQLLDTLK
jgi:hypothetical protein